METKDVLKFLNVILLFLLFIGGLFFFLGVVLPSVKRELLIFDIISLVTIILIYTGLIGLLHMYLNQKIEKWKK